MTELPTSSDTPLVKRFDNAGIAVGDIHTMQAFCGDWTPAYQDAWAVDYGVLRPARR